MKRRRNDWHSVTLPEISTVFTDGPFGSNLKSAHYVDHGVRVIRLQNIGVGKMINDDLVFITREHYESLPRNHCKPGDVVIGTLGEPNLRACVIPPDVPEALNKADCLLLRLDEKRADRDFICAALNSDVTVKRAMGLVRGQTRGRISMGRLKELRIPLPPLAEQRRIAGILDAADALRAKRREALAQLDTLLQSTFLDMFGDPVTNPMGWEDVKVDTIGSVQGGLQVTAKRRSLPIERPYLRVANVFRGYLDLSEVKTIRMTEAEECRTTLEDQDILIVEGHGNREEIGRCSRWDNSIRPCVHQNHLIRLRCHREKVDPVFVEYYINSPGGRRELTGTSRTTSGLNTISVSKVRAANIKHPPLDLQRRFAAIVESVERQKAQMCAHLAELDALFASLQSRAFNGEL